MWLQRRGVIGVGRLAFVALFNFWPVWPQPSWFRRRVSPGLRGLVILLACVASAFVASLAFVAWPWLVALLDLWPVWPQPTWLIRRVSPGLVGLVEPLAFVASASMALLAFVAWPWWPCQPLGLCGVSLRGVIGGCRLAFVAVFNFWSVWLQL